MSNSLQRRVSITLAAVIVLLVFVVRPARAQTFTTLASFQGTNGSNPFYVSLIQGTDGNYKGTTERGGIGMCFFSDGCGTVFKISSSGRLTSSTVSAVKVTVVGGTRPLPDCFKLPTETLTELLGTAA
jgi:hypothetical protein